jgi:hypothetical protein
MLYYIIAAVAIVVAAVGAKAALNKAAETKNPDVQKHREGVASERAEALRNHYSKVRAKFGNANPGVMFALGAILTVFFVLALRTTFATYSWLFLGLGWSESSANLYAVIPFTIVFVFALIVKLCVWDLVRSFLFGDKVEGASAFGRIIATVVGLVLFTGVVLQLAPIASVRSERYIGPDVVQAQEDLSALEVECVEAPRPSCEAEIASAEAEVVAAEARLENGKKTDRIMASFVPFGELVTAFGPIILIEVLALVTVPFMRMRGAEKKRDKHRENLVKFKGSVIDVSESKEPVRELAGS